MSALTWGAVAVVVLLTLLALRVHIAVAMFATGLMGYVWVAGGAPLLASLKTMAYARYSNYDLSVVPLFLLMGQFATHGGLSRALFRAGHALVGHWRGGMAMGAVGACAGFGAICGSSLATAATMGQVALPELREHGYSERFATAVLAAGGTLGILIPPSVPLVIYAILAEQNIAKLFIAAFIPGLLATLGYVLVIAIVARISPSDAPAVGAQPWRQRLKALGETWPVLLIFLVVIGGIYGGVFTPTEAAAIGAVATGLVAWRNGGLDRRSLVQCLLGTAGATGMIFLILLGSDMLNVFFALVQLPTELAHTITQSGFSPLGVLLVMLLIYLVLGCIMDSLSMILLTIPIFFPIVMGVDLWGLGADDKAIWFGVLALMVVEIGLITPPVGLNVFIISSMAKQASMRQTFRYVLPFLASDVLRIALVMMVPSIALVALRVF